MATNNCGRDLRFKISRQGLLIAFAWMHAARMSSNSSSTSCMPLMRCSTCTLTCSHKVAVSTSQPAATRALQEKYTSSRCEGSFGMTTCCRYMQRLPCALPPHTLALSGCWACLAERCRPMSALRLARLRVPGTPANPMVGISQSIYL